MKKIPYEIVEVEASKILQRMLSAQDSIESSNIQEEYFQYLNACGWTLEEYDQELMKRVDADWDNSPVQRFDN